MAAMIKRRPWLAVAIARSMATVVTAGVMVVLCCLLLGVPFAEADLKTSFVIAPPFDKHDHRGSRIIPYWDKTGSSNIMQSFVRVSFVIWWSWLLLPFI